MAKEYGVAGEQPIDLFKMDNESGIKVAYNPEHFGRMKHVDRRHTKAPGMERARRHIATGRHIQPVARVDV